MKISKINLVCLVVCICFSSFIFTSTKSHAAGFPVIDASNLTQNLAGFMKQLKQLTTAMKQLSVMTQQYKKLMQQYNQIMIEYKHYLNQIQSVSHLINEEDWMGILEIVGSKYGQRTVAALPYLDPVDPQYQKKVDVVMKDQKTYVCDPKDTRQRAKMVGADTEQLDLSTRRNRNTYEQYTDQMRLAAENEKKADKRKVSIGKMASTTKNLGDESDLATMQLMANQNQMIMKQNEALIELLNQQLLLKSLQDTQKAADLDRLEQVELARLEQRRIEGSTGGMGKDNFDSF